MEELLSLNPIILSMKKVIILSSFLLAAGVLTAQKAQLTYPDTRKVDTVTTYHGMKVADPYRWLEDDKSEETKEWVTAQNKVTSGYFENIPYRTQWLQRLEELNNYPKYGSPFRNNNDYYYYKN